VVLKLFSPFIDTSFLDGVHVQEDLIKDFPPKVLALRKHFFPDATEFKDRSIHSRPSRESLSSAARFLNE